MKVLFFQTVHTADDDRIRYHQRVSLEQAGHTCSYASRAEEIDARPDIVICDTPVAIRKVRKALGRRTHVVYDITEWYPSKKNIRFTPLLLKPFKYCLLMFANYWAGWSADRFIFGEKDKARPFRFLFPWKQYIYLPYYPSLRYIRPSAPSGLKDEVRLFYAGPQTAEKGFERVQRITQACQSRMPDRRVTLTTLYGVPFDTFCEEITRQDFFLDLRNTDPENTRCLPIKLFYYMAAGRPVIYSDLKAIRKGVPEIAADSLFDPDDCDKIVRFITQTVSSPERYNELCIRNRQLAEERYNWERIAADFVEFTEKMQ